MIAPLHYVSGRDCGSLFEATCALYAEYPAFTSYLLLLAVLAVLFCIYAFYAVFIRRDDDD